MERRGIAQARPNDAQPGPHARGTTEGQALVEHLDGVRQVPLSEVQPTETAMGNDRCLPSAFERGEAECLLAMTPALGEGPERAKVCASHARGLIRWLRSVPTSRSAVSTFCPLVQPPGGQQGLPGVILLGHRGAKEGRRRVPATWWSTPP